MDRCKTCKFWDQSQVDEELPDLGTCERVAFLPDVTEWNEDCSERVLIKQYENTLAFVCDGSGYTADLFTKPNFGCIHHEFDLSENSK